MNADLEEAVGLLVDPQVEPPAPLLPRSEPKKLENHWAWRLEMAEHIASLLDGERFGVAAMYVIGSVKNATAGPESDIDLMAHFRGTKKQLRELAALVRGLEPVPGRDQLPADGL